MNKFLIFIWIKDTAEGIAQELITAGLVDSKDFIVVAANLEKLKQHHKELGYRLLLDENIAIEKNGQSFQK